MPMTPQQFASVTNAMREPMLLVSLDSHIKGLNHAAARLLGDRAEALLEHPMADYLRSPIDRFEAYLRACAGTTQFMPGSIVIRGPGDESRPFRCDGAKLHALERTAPTSIIVRLRPKSVAVGDFAALNSRIAELNREIAERRQAEERAHAINKELIRTRDDLQRQTAELIIKSRDLELAREAAEAASRAKNAFMANISHEIRTPMNAIVGLLEILTASNLDDDQRECATIIQEGANSLMGVLNDVLDFSKLEAGHLSFETIDFDLETKIVAIERMFALEAQRKGLDLAMTFEEQVPRRLRGDPLRLRQVLVNLISNAIKFTDAGQVRLSMRREAESQTHVLLGFEITDTGIGISENVQPQLFNAFTQADDSTTRRFGGTGLGLTICKRLVELMGGNIGIKSVLGQGSTFWFTACFEKQDADSESTPELGDARPSLSMPANPPSLLDVQPCAALDGATRILVVEDNPVNLKVALRQLDRLGYRDVLSAQNGLRALEVLSSESIDLILMDCQMPELDGYATCRLIREGEAGGERHVPIIAMTAHAMDDSLATCLDAGMDDYVAKPVTLERLERVLRRQFAMSTNVHEP